MMKRYLIPTIAALIALSGCTKEIQEQGVQPADSGNVHALSVEIESGAYEAVGGETKASMEAVIRVKWKQNDSVSVVNATKNKLLGGCLKAQSDGESVVFEGTVTGPIEPGDKLYYIYPRVEDNTEEKAFAGYVISLAGQRYDGNKIDSVCFYGYAKDEAGSGSQNESTNISRKIKFTLVTSYVHLNMANLPTKGTSTSLSCIDISNVNEGFTWKLSEEKTLSATPCVGNKAISVKCSNADITPSGNAVARFAIPASVETDEARVVTVNNAYTNNMYTKLELPAASYYNQLYTTWTENKAVVNTTEDPSKTKVTINNNNSKDVAEGEIPTTAFGKTGEEPKPTEISIGGMGTITFDEDATSRILENASGSTSVLFKVEDVTTTKPVTNADIVYEVTMKTLDENGTEVFPDAKGTAAEDTPGRATISIPLDVDVMYVHTIAFVDKDGNQTNDGVVPESIELDPDSHILTFQVEHFSKYAVGYVKKDAFVSVTGVTLNKEAMTLAVGGDETLTATVDPDNATNKKVKWSSSNKDVATVDKDGKVTAVAAGTATITVTTEDGAQTATCTVTVKPEMTMAELLETLGTTANRLRYCDKPLYKIETIEDLNNITIPEKAWVNLTNPACKAFIYKDTDEDEDGNEIVLDFFGPMTAFEVSEDEVAVPRLGLYMTDDFVKVDDETYRRVEGFVIFTAKMTDGVFSSYEVEVIESEVAGTPLEDLLILAGTYAAPKISAPTETGEEEDIL